MSPQEDFAAMVAGLEAAGLSRAEIAKKAGVSRTTVWRLLNGVGKNHYHDTIQRIDRLAEKVGNRREPLRSR